MIPIQAKLAVGAVILASAFWAGWEWRDREADAQLLQKDKAFTEYRLAAEEAARVALQGSMELRETKDQLAALAAEAAALRNREREVVERVIIQEVIRYVSNPTSERVFLPGDWVRIHDAAATGSIGSLPGPYRPDTATGLNAAASPSFRR